MGTLGQSFALQTSVTIAACGVRHGTSAERSGLSEMIAGSIRGCGEL